MREKTLSFKFLMTALVCLLLLFSFSSCRLHQLEKKLNPENAEFLSKVRYIITKEERKIFLELPDADKEDFKKEFWKKRDPDPLTEENEFKMEYFNRIEITNELFVSEVHPRRLGFLLLCAGRKECCHNYD